MPKVAIGTITMHPSSPYRPFPVALRHQTLTGTCPIPQEILFCRTSRALTSVSGRSTTTHFPDKWMEVHWGFLSSHIAAILNLAPFHGTIRSNVSLNQSRDASFAAHTTMVPQPTKLLRNSRIAPSTILSISFSIASLISTSCCLVSCFVGLASFTTDPMRRFTSCATLGSASPGPSWQHASSPIV